LPRRGNARSAPTARASGRRLRDRLSVLDRVIEDLEQPEGSACADAVACLTRIFRLDCTLAVGGSRIFDPDPPSGAARTARRALPSMLLPSKSSAHTIRNRKCNGNFSAHPRAGGGPPPAELCPGWWPAGLNPPRGRATGRRPRRPEAAHASAERGAAASLCVPRRRSAAAHRRASTGRRRGQRAARRCVMTDAPETPQLVSASDDSDASVLETRPRGHFASGAPHTRN